MQCCACIINISQTGVPITFLSMLFYTGCDVFSRDNVLIHLSSGNIGEGQCFNVLISSY